MSIQAVAWALDRYVPDPLKKLILISLANHADSDGLCWPRMRLIAKEASCSRETVVRKLPELEKDGLIQVGKEAGRKRAHTYRLLIPPNDAPIDSEGLAKLVAESRFGRRNRCDPDAHLRCDRGAHHDVREDHIGCDPAITSKNHHRTINRKGERHKGNAYARLAARLSRREREL